MTAQPWFCSDCHHEQLACVPQYREPGWLDGDVICPACRVAWERKCQVEPAKVPHDPR